MRFRVVVRKMINDLGKLKKLELANGEKEICDRLENGLPELEKKLVSEVTSSLPRIILSRNESCRLIESNKAVLEDLESLAVGAENPKLKSFALTGMRAACDHLTVLLKLLEDGQHIGSDEPYSDLNTPKSWNAVLEWDFNKVPCDLDTLKNPQTTNNTFNGKYSGFCYCPGSQVGIWPEKVTGTKNDQTTYGVAANFTASNNQAADLIATTRSDSCCVIF